MRLLFIGGTQFVGRHMVGEAMARGHEVTLFHTGKGEDPFPEAAHVHGDRSTDLDALSGGDWDAVIDVCAYVPREVRLAAQALSGSARRYCYISTNDVYRRTGAATVTEESPLWDAADLEDPATEDVDSFYGQLKALCEAEAIAGWDEVTTVRPTYVLGPFDNTDRFTYWVRRGAEGGEILAPAPADAAAQVIDARDLAGFTIGLIERGVSGAFNGVGPTMTFEEMLSACLTSPDAELTWVDPGFLVERGVDVGRELPLWNPPEEYQILRSDASKSLGEGLEIRPLSQTVDDSLAWDRDRGLPPLADVLPADRERELLEAWRTG